MAQSAKATTAARSVASVDAAKARNRDESKRDKFVRLVNKRLDNALKTTSRLEALFGGSYGWTEADHELVIDQLLQAVQRVKAAAKPKREKGATGRIFISS